MIRDCLPLRRLRPLYSPWPEGSWQWEAGKEWNSSFPLEIPSPAPSPVVRQGGTNPGNPWELDSLGIQGVAQGPRRCRFVFQGIQCPMDNQGAPMFLRDIRCVFPSGIPSRKSLAPFAFQEVLVSLCFCQRSQRVGGSFGVSFLEFRASEQHKGTGGSQVLLPWFCNSMEAGAVWHLDHFSPSSCSSSHGSRHLGDQNISWKKAWEKAPF